MEAGRDVITELLISVSSRTENCGHGDEPEGESGTLFLVLPPSGGAL